MGFSFVSFSQPNTTDNRISNTVFSMLKFDANENLVEGIVITEEATFEKVFSNEPVALTVYVVKEDLSSEESNFSIQYIGNIFPFKTVEKDGKTYVIVVGERENSKIIKNTVLNMEDVLK